MRKERIKFSNGYYTAQFKFLFIWLNYQIYYNDLVMGEVWEPASFATERECNAFLYENYNEK